MSNTVNENETNEDDESGARKRFTDADFAAARELYELGKASIADLCDEYAISRQTLSKRFKDVGAIKGSRAHEVAGATGAAAKAVVETYAETRATLIEETRVEGLKALKQARMIGQKMVVDQIKRSAAASAGSTSLAPIDDDLKALGRYNKVLIDNIGRALEILKADEMIDSGAFPVLTVEDLTDQDILEHYKSTGVLDDDATLDDINTD